MKHKANNQIETMGLMAAVNPFEKFNSASRAMMVTHHLAQAVTPANPDIPYCLTGYEDILPSFDIVIPCKALIISKHTPGLLLEQSRNKIPYETIIFQDTETGIYDTLDIPRYVTRHLNYGNKMTLTHAGLNLRPEQCLPKGTLLAYGPTNKNGLFTNSVRCNFVNASILGTHEDGYVVTEAFCQKAALNEITSTATSYGKKRYLLNTYGNSTVFKGFPDIGERIRDDGLVFALREYDDRYNALEMTNKALMTIDPIHDTLVYGTAGAYVYDILVESGIGESSNKPNTSPYMGQHPEKYIQGLSTYYQSILNVYNKLMKNKNIRLSKRLTQLCTRAIADKPNAERNKKAIVRRTRDKIPLDEYNVIVYTSKMIPLRRGDKITGYHGNKGVICKIIKTEDAPIDAIGNRADVIGFARSSVARLNDGQFYEQHISACVRDLSFWVKTNYGQLDNSVLWERVLSFYKIVAPEQYNAAVNMYATATDINEHLKTIVDDAIYLLIPANAEHINYDIIAKLDNIIKPCYGPITYVDANNETVVTEDKLFIGVQQMMILEKSDQRPTAISTAPLQSHGLLAGSSKVTRNSYASRVQTTKNYSETETRLYSATLGSEILAELLAANNSSIIHRDVVKKILSKKFPTRSYYLDRMDTTTARPFKFINNTLTSFGLTIKKYI